MDENTHNNQNQVENNHHMPMQWRDVAITVGKILKNQKPLMALAVSPILAVLTTVLFMSIYYARPNGPCQEAKDLIEDYGAELISHALCCLPEWPIGAVGLSISGALGLYAVPHIWRSRGATGGCCCYSQCCCKGCCGELCRTSSPFCAICIALMSTGLIIVSIVSLSLSEITNFVARTLFFFGGLILKVGRVNRLITCSFRSIVPNVESNEWLPGSYQYKLAIVMKVFDISSLMLCILAFTVRRFETTSYVASESLYASICLFVLYSVLTEMLIHHFDDEDGIHDDNIDSCGPYEEIFVAEENA